MRERGDNFLIAQFFGRACFAPFYSRLTTTAQIVKNPSNHSRVLAYRWRAASRRLPKVASSTERPSMMERRRAARAERRREEVHALVSRGRSSSGSSGTSGTVLGGDMEMMASTVMERDFSMLTKTMLKRTMLKKTMLTKTMTLTD